MHIAVKGNIRRYWFCCLLLVFGSLPGYAQESAPVAPTSQLVPAARAQHQRPTLGLVLEGGGALGLAHIGVIEWLEEHRIPVNYIAGTSMGGLVGGVYATGRNASEVKELVKNINWDQVVRGQTPYQNLSFRRKQDAHDFPSTLEFGLRHGVQLPSGFNSGQQVDLILDRIALPYDELNSFDDLPIPFACVATDLVTDNQQVFRSGRLDLALRSTMSLPGIFTPVRSEGHIYVDGGLLNNVPVDVAKEMGADITLAVHLEIPPLKPDASLSLFSVLTQSISSVVSANERRGLALADLVISVPLERFDAMDYDSADLIIKAGYAAAEANAEKLETLAVDEESWKQYLAQRENRRREPPVPQFVEVTGVNNDIAAPMTHELAQFAGKPIDLSKLEGQLLEENGMGAFSSVNYSMGQRNSQQSLDVVAQPKPYSPPIVRPLVVIDGSDYNDVFFSVGARITFLDFGGYRREWRNDVMLGSEYEIASEYYRPLTGTSKWFIAPRLGLDSSQYPVFEGSTLLTLYRNRLVGGGVDGGYAFGRTGELRFGYEGGYQHLSPQIGSTSELPTISGATGDARIQFTLNTLDDPVTPHHGEHIKFYTKYFNTNPAAPHGFPLSELQLQNFFRLTERSTVFLHGYGGTSFGNDAGVPAFQLGSTTRFVAYGTNELLTNQYFLFQSGYIRTLKDLPPLLGSTIDFLAMVEGGKTYQLPLGPKPPHLPGDVVGALVVNTLFGPVEVGGAVGNYGHSKFFFQVGRIF